MDEHGNPTYLESDGALLVQIRLRPVLDHKRKGVWFPIPPGAPASLARLWDTGLAADVTFLIDETEVQAHRSILALHAPDLYDMVQSAEQSGPSVVITNVTVPVFKSFLRFLYHGDYLLPSPRDNEDTTNNANFLRSLLHTADRFGASDLKLQVESSIVQSFLLPDNVASWIVLADSLSCAYLKEAAMVVFRSHADAIMASDAWSQIHESPPLLKELISTALRLQQAESIVLSGNNVQFWNVPTLRNHLLSRNMEIDGSREMLVQQCLAAEADERAKKRKRTEKEEEAH